MHNLDNVEQIQAALAVYRRTLAYCIHEQMKFGPQYVPPSIVQSMLEARENIRYLKALLRIGNIPVADWPNDQIPLPHDYVLDQERPAAPLRTLPQAHHAATAPHVSTQSGELHLDAGVPTDSSDDPVQGSGDSPLGPATCAQPPFPTVATPGAPNQPDAAISTTLPGYELTGPIVQSEQVTIYRATHLRLSRPVLVHFLSPTDQSAVGHADDRQPVAVRLSHPNVMPVLEVGHDERFGPYLVTPYVEVCSLQDMLARGPLEPLLALHICTQIGTALEELHSRGVVHGHISPSTVLITPHGGAYLIGLERAAEVGAAHIAVPSSSTDKTLETPDAAPDTPTPADDLAGLGALLHRMLHGEPHSPDQDAPSLDRFDTVLAVVDQVIRVLRAPSLDQRYDGVGQALAALRQAFPQQLVELADYLQASRWHPAARWLENPLEAVLGCLLAEEFLVRSRARANAHHRVGATQELLDRRRTRRWLRRTRPGQEIQPDHIVSYNLYFYELRVHYETRAAPRTRERALEGDSVPQRTSPDLWAVAVPYVEPFVDVLPEQVGAGYAAACETCRGTTRVLCPACAGKGEGEQKRWVTYHDGTTVAVTLQTRCPTCNTQGWLRCVRCRGVGQVLQEQTFMWSRRGRIYFNEDDLSGLRRQTVARHAQQVFRAAIDLYDPRWHQTAPLQELFTAALSGGGPDSRPIAGELIIRGVPITEVDYVAGARPRSIILVGFDDEVHGG